MRVETLERSRNERAKNQTSPGALRCRRKFLRFYPGGFRDEDYIEAEREYKWESHLRWREALDGRRIHCAIAGGTL